MLALATGQLAQQLRQDAAQAVKTQLQEVSQSYSRGRYVGVIRRGGGRAIVVTYEEVAPLGGQAQGAYQVYLARTEHTTHGWRVTRMAASDRQLDGRRSGRPGSRPLRRAGLAATMLESYCLLWLGTLLAAVLAIPIAGYLRGVFDFRLTLAPPGSASMAALIAANNVRAAAVPLLLRGPRESARATLARCIVGDVVVGASLAANVALGGLALGAYGLGLLRYLPQWPLGVGRTRARPRRLAASSARATGPLRAGPARDRRRDPPVPRRPP